MVAGILSIANNGSTATVISADGLKWEQNALQNVSDIIGTTFNFGNTTTNVHGDFHIGIATSGTLSYKLQVQGGAASGSTISKCIVVFTKY